MEGINASALCEATNRKANLTKFEASEPADHRTFILYERNDDVRISK